MTTIPPTAPAIAFLGTGRMGGPMAANLARGGFSRAQRAARGNRARGDARLLQKLSAI